MFDAFSLDTAQLTYLSIIHKLQEVFTIVSTGSLPPYEEDIRIFIRLIVEIGVHKCQKKICTPNEVPRSILSYTLPS